MSELKAVPTVMIEDERVRVTEWRFAPGAATGYHVHEHDYVVVPITTGTLRAEGLGLEAVQLEGQLLPGLSVVRAIASSADIEQQRPQLPVITFPGNLGTEETLKDAWLLFEREI